MALPLFITCQNPRCEKVRQVRKPYEQKRRKFCSHRCAALTHKGPTKADARRGGLMNGHRRREAVRLKVADMTPLEAFRYGYTLGLQSKWRKTAAVKQKASAA